MPMEQDPGANETPEELEEPQTPPEDDPPPGDEVDDGCGKKPGQP